MLLLLRSPVPVAPQTLADDTIGNPWVVISDSAGTVYGDGPITTLVGWQSVKRLDRAGAFSFQMPATDPRADLCRPFRIATCYGMVGGRVTELGSGIIAHKQLQPGRPSYLQVSGDDLLRELAQRTVGNLQLSAALTWEPSDANYHDPDAHTTTALPGTFTLAAGDYLYIGHTEAFESVTLTLGGSVNNNAATLSGQFFNDTIDVPGWESVKITSDTTASPAGTPLAQSGTIAFDPPQGWGKTMHNAHELYWIRLYCNAALDAVQVTALVVSKTSPVDPLPYVDDFFPAGWSWDKTNGRSHATRRVYLQMAGESVLATLCRIAEQTGEHFRLGTGRTVTWLGGTNDAHITLDSTLLNAHRLLELDETVTGATSEATGKLGNWYSSVGGTVVALYDVTGTFEAGETLVFGTSGATGTVASVDVLDFDSGIHAQRGPASSPDACAILALTEVHDATELVSRVYPYGGGTGSERTTLADASVMDPDGYVVDEASNYVERTAAETYYGYQIDTTQVWPDVVARNTTPAQKALASKELLKRALEYLKRHSATSDDDVPRFYSLTVSAAPLLPGQTLRVVYHEWTDDGYHAVSVDETLRVIEVTDQIAPGGPSTLGLQVGTIDRWPVTEAEVLTEHLEKASLSRNVTPSGGGYTKLGGGTPKAVYVENGKITGVSVVKAIDDGQYEIPSGTTGYIVVEGGIIKSITHT
jgi:hypothetical protein